MLFHYIRHTEPNPSSVHSPRSDQTSSDLSKNERFEENLYAIQVSSTVRGTRKLTTAREVFLEFLQATKRWLEIDLSITPPLLFTSIISLRRRKNYEKSLIRNGNFILNWNSVQIISNNVLKSSNLTRSHLLNYSKFNIISIQTIPNLQ